MASYAQTQRVREQITDAASIAGLTAPDRPCYEREREAILALLDKASKILMSTLSTASAREMNLPDVQGVGARLQAWVLEAKRMNR